MFIGRRDLVFNVSSLKVAKNQDLKTNSLDVVLDRALEAGSQRGRVLVTQLSQMRQQVENSKHR